VTKVNHIGALHSDLTLGTRWLTQMATAARRCGMTIQYCMSQPRHVLTALLLPSVTQVSDVTVPHVTAKTRPDGSTPPISHAGQ